MTTGSQPPQVSQPGLEQQAHRYLPVGLTPSSTCATPESRAVDWCGWNDDVGIYKDREDNLSHSRQGRGRHIRDMPMIVIDRLHRSTCGANPCQLSHYPTVYLTEFHPHDVVDSDREQEPITAKYDIVSLRMEPPLSRIHHTHLLAKCGLLTTINPQISQSVGTSQTLLPHLGHK